MKQYINVLSPVVVNGKVLRNRLGMSRAIPTFTVGVEDEKPMESVLTYVDNMAASGAAIVPLPAVAWPHPNSRPMQMPPRPFEMDDEDGEEKKPKADDGLPTARTHSEGVDLSIRNNRIFYARMASAVHSYGALCSMGISDAEPRGWDINDVPLEILEDLPERFARVAVDYAAVGVDVLNVHMSYGGTLLCRSLSPKNRRTDRFGGNNPEERARLSLEVFRRVKAVCPGCILQVQISGEEPEGGYTLEDLCKFAKLWDGLVDIYQIRGATDAAAHPSGVNSERGKPVTLTYASRLKELGLRALIGPVGGYGQPDLIEQAIADGKCDLVFMSRSFIAEPNYVEKLMAGRGSDIIPCLLCNKCHVRPGDPDFGCSVNPQLAISMNPNFLTHIRPVAQPKKVAVIGGGPAGMAAAVTAADRGHIVTLYEKSSELGGQLLHAQYVDFKWPLVDYLEYLKGQIISHQVHVQLLTEATPELLADENYDTILYAAGAEEILPGIPGIRDIRVWKPLDVFGHEDQLGKRILVVGGSDTGVETAWHLAILGKTVVNISRRMPEGFFKDADRYRARMKRSGNGGSMESIPKVTGLMLHPGFATAAIKKEKIEIPFDDAVVCGGVGPVRKNIAEFSRICRYFRVIGDSNVPGDIRTGVKDAYAAAMLI